MTVIPGYYIVEGWMSRAQMYAIGAKVKSLPFVDRAWHRPGNEADVVTSVKTVDTPSGGRYAMGALTFMWPMQGLSPRMAAYIQTTYFNSGLGTDTFFKRAQWNNLTVQTYNRYSGEWETYQVRARIADAKTDVELSQGGFNNFKIFFTAHKAAPSGPDIELETNISGTRVAGLPFTVNPVLTNIGDESTFNDIIVTMAIPTHCSFDSVFLSSYTSIQYSTDSGLTYSSSAPGDLTTITHVKTTTTAAIGKDDVVSDLSFTLNANTVGSTSVTVTCTTGGDTDTSNNQTITALTISAFTPAAYSSLELWLDAQTDVYQDSLVTLASNNDAVHTWKDQSSSHANAVQVTGTNRPLFKTGQTNGKSAVLFDGINDYQVINSGALSFGTANTTVIIVTKPTNDATVPGPETFFAFDSRQMVVAHKVDNTTDDQSGIFFASGAVASPFDSAQNTLQVLTYKLVGGVSATLYRNTSQIASNSVSNFPGFNGGTVGADSLDQITYGNFFKGLIYEILVYTEAITTQQRNNIESYLMTKYNV